MMGISRHVFGWAVALIVVVGMVAANGVTAGGRGAHWGYKGEVAPERWAELDPAYETCAKGLEQSPINIATKKAKAVRAESLKVHYKNVPLEVINNGHTIQVNYPEGSYMELDSKKYDLLQFHFHSPSEHQVDGQAGAMVAHLVHKSKGGKLAVIGVLFNTGRENPLIRKIWEHLPTHEGEQRRLSKTTINVRDLVPRDRSFYNYPGSLTTPPCTEGVNWLVMEEVVSISDEQVGQFTDIFPKSVRPTQAINKRKVYLNQ